MSLKTIVALTMLSCFVSISHAAQGKADIFSTSTNTMVSGTARFEDTKDGLKVSVMVKNAIPGQHGFHIHEFGSCADLGKAAGNHYNPLHSEHGLILKGDKHMAHMGDLGNITINADGTGTLEAVIPDLTLSGGVYAVGGRSLVFHDKVDDFSQPLGNAGGRLGCGVIVISGNQ